MKWIALIFAAMLFASCYGKKAEHTSKEGQMLPAFKILLPDSATWVNTKDIISNEPIVFFLFGPHCPFSKAQMQDIIDHACTVEYIQFYVITPYPFNQMKEFYKDYKLKDYSNIITGVDPINFFGNYIEAGGVPFLAIYGRDKKLIKTFTGKTDISHINESF